MATFVLDPSVNVTSSVPRFNPKGNQRRQYKDRQFKGTDADWKKKLEASTTVYVGNLSCYTNEYQLYELFTRCGSIKRVIMGLDKIKKTPCGFCFVEFDDRKSAVRSINLLNRTHLDGREIQVDIDAGFEEGRQYGRGSQGGQIGDERRREHGGGHAQRTIPGSTLPTRFITLVACIALISVFLIASESDIVYSAPVVVNRPSMNLTTQYRHKHAIPYGSRLPYITLTQVQSAQIGANRAQYEKAFAQFLVNIMKAAKPSLLKAFISATLADKQLKEIAIGLFFNNTSTDDDS